MDISKYRTRFPPKEHEEAVRMLLEGLDKPTTTTLTRTSGQHDLKPEVSRTAANYRRRPASALNSNAPSRAHHEVSPTSSIDSGSLAQCDDPDEMEDDEDELEAARYRHRQRHQQADSTSGELHNDELDFNSEDSNSLDQIQVSPRVPSKHFHSIQHQRQQSMNKLTNKRLVEQQLSAPRMQSRATSTTSDSMSAAARSTDDDDAEPPADCDSIPNRTIAIQCDLKVSSVKRDGFLLTDSASSDLASMQASSISSTRFGFYKLSPSTMEERRQLARSISSRNIAHQSDGEADEQAHKHAESEADSSTVDVEECDEPAQTSKRPRVAPLPESGSELSHQAATSLRKRLDERLLERRNPANSTSGSRFRDSLPRRPKTALSYVSNSRLRDEEASDRSQSEAEDIDQGSSVRRRGPQQVVQRAMSHQVLSSDGKPAARRPLMKHEFDAISSSNSDAESGVADRLRVPRNEEILVTRHSRQVPHSATPSNYTAARTRPYTNNSPASKQPRRSQTLTNAIEELPVASRRPLTSLTNNLDHLNLSELEDGLAAEPAREGQTCAKFASSHEPKQLSRYGSLSLSRAGARAANERSCKLISGQIRRATRNANDPPPATGAAGLRVANHLDLGGRAATLTRKDRSSSQQTLPSGRTLTKGLGGESTRPSLRQKTNCPSDSSLLSSRIGRSTSMKQVNSIAPLNGSRFLSPSARQRTPLHQEERISRRQYTDDCDSTCCEQAGVIDGPTESGHPDGVELEALGRQSFEGRPPKRLESDDSESPKTRTWANPGSTRVAGTQRRSSGASRNPVKAQVNYDDEEEESGEYQLEQLGAKRVHQTGRVYRADEGMRCASDEASEEQEMNSATWSLANEQQQQPLDFDSQQRLNEIGLPEHPNVQQATLERRQMGASANSSASSSHLGLSPGFATRSTHYATTGRWPAGTMQAPLAQSRHSQRGPAITGRAMSQQSLTRPTMPLSRRLRRSGNASGSQSGASDVGGSSISLVSRMRYENAHTRSPVVMYIPQAMPKSASSEHIKLAGASTLLRKSSRQSVRQAGSRHSSQDRARRTSSRQASDSEASSSSMLRTLVKPRSSCIQTPRGPNCGSGLGRVPSGRRRQAAMRRDFSDDEENMDEIGQLATEIDSYKFRRRYSVPKDAKINWFSKLKKRVTSSKA